MKAKKLILPVFILVFMIGLAGIAFGASTFVTPGASARIGGTAYVVNISCGLSNTMNASFSASSASTGGSLASTWAYNSTHTNFVNATITTVGMRDANDYVFSGTCYNASDSQTVTSRTGVTIDNGVPVISACTINSVTATTTQQVDASTTDLSCTVQNATTCSVYWKDSTADTFATYASGSSDVGLTALSTSASYATAGTSITATLHNIGDSYDNVYVTCSDGTNTTTDSTYQIRAEGISNTQKQIKRGLFGTNTQVDNSKKNILLILLVAITFVVGAWFFLKK